MTRNEALNLLSLNAQATNDDIAENIDSKIFSLRDYFLNQPVIPLLYKLKVERLQQIESISKLLKVKSFGMDICFPEIKTNGTGLKNLVLNYVENVIRLRSAMASTLDPAILIVLANCIIGMQEGYMVRFMSDSEEYSNVSNKIVAAKDEVNWTDFIDALNINDLEKISGFVSMERERISSMMNPLVLS